MAPFGILFKTLMLSNMGALLHRVQAETTTTTEYPWCKDFTGKFTIISSYLPNPIPKTCNWIKDYKEDRCNLPEAKAYCAELCGTCHCRNNNEPFDVQGIEWNCLWASKNPSLRCKMDGVERNCPLSCGLCEAPVGGTSSPTSSPAASTSLSPSSSFVPAPIPDKAKLQSMVNTFCNNPEHWWECPSFDASNDACVYG
jgi:hypothetical protein